MAKNPEELCAAAKASHKADPKNKDLKKAYKSAKKAAESWKEEQAKAAAEKEKADKKSAKKAKKESKKRKAEPEVDLESLKAAAKAAKAAHKANSKDAALKAAYKAAKKAVKEAPAAKVAKEEAPAAKVAKSPAAKAIKTSAAEPEPVAEESWEEETKTEDDSWKKKEEWPAKKAWGSDKPAAAANPPNPKLFLGNLSWDIDDDGIKEFFKDCGTLTDIHWLTDKESGKFKGCGFVTFEDVEGATKAQAKTGEIVAGRDIKIEFASARPGAAAGAPKKSGGGGGGAQKAMSARPDNCTTVFAGNLSWDVDDDIIREFAKEAGEVKAIRWLTDKDSGEFRGCGFIEFWDAESVDKFVLKNGQDLQGRAIRLDYSAPRERKEQAW